MLDKQTAKLIARIAENLPLLDKDRMQFWIDKPAILKVFLIGLLPEESTCTLPSTILTVDYSKSLAEMIAAGHYDWVNDRITAKRFPIVGEGVVRYEAKFFPFPHDISSEDAERQIREGDKENPWKVSPIECTLAYGAANPEEQRKGPIIGLGSLSKFGRRRRVLCLNMQKLGRSLDLDLHDSIWLAYCRFLAVRKIVAV